YSIIILGEHAISFPVCPGNATMQLSHSQVHYMPPSPRPPELLAPARDGDCVRAAIENGADAVYFGLDTGFNARARAKNFDVADLPRLMTDLHRRGLKGYVTLNTLVFTSELPEVEQLVRQIAVAGVDAVLVQDLGLVRLIRAVC